MPRKADFMPVALNEGQYLVPRLSAVQQRLVNMEPATAAGGVGDDLLLQHLPQE